MRRCMIRPACDLGSRKAQEELNGSERIFSWVWPSRYPLFWVFGWLRGLNLVRRYEDSSHCFRLGFLRCFDAGIIKNSVF